MGTPFKGSLNGLQNYCALPNPGGAVVWWFYVGIIITISARVHAAQNIRGIFGNILFIAIVPFQISQKFPMLVRVMCSILILNGGRRSKNFHVLL